MYYVIKCNFLDRMNPQPKSFLEKSVHKNLYHIHISHEYLLSIDKTLFICNFIFIRDSCHPSYTLAYLFVQFKRNDSQITSTAFTFFKQEYFLNFMCHFR